MTALARSDWDEVCARVRRKEDPFFHDPWLDRIAFVTSNDNNVVLATPNRFYLDFIRENLDPILTRYLRDVTQCDWRIAYELDEGLNPGSTIAEPHAPPPPPPPRDFERSSAAPASSYYFQLNPNQTFASFIVGSGNSFASAACQAVGDKPAGDYNPLFIFGGVGLGKTHLLNAIGNRIMERDRNARIVYLSAEDFTNEMINALRFKRMEEFREKYRRRCDALLVDDIQFLAGRERTQEEFFHTFNALHSSGRQIVVTADRYPKDIKGLEERLRSRFDWGLVADVQPPDTETKVAILRKKADDEGIELPQDVAFFIARYAANNIRGLEGALKRLLAMSSLQAAPITLEYTRSCLQGYLQVEEPTASCESIASGVAKFFDVKMSDMKGPRRTKQIVMPRQIAMYLARKHTGLSLPEIGRRFGGRDHTTVIHAVKKVKARMQEDSYRTKVELVARSVGLPTDPPT
jgi:chromosomal replication initiator protein